MKISTYTFNKYLEQRYIDNFENFYRCFDNKDITFLTFNRWKVFYEADPDNWKFHHDTYTFNKNENIYFPYYLYIEDGGNKYKLIKFPTKREYKKFYRFYKKNIEHNLDGRENQQEILELAKIIGQRATIRAEETQKKLQEDYKDYYKIVERCNKNTNFDKFFPTTYTVTSTLDQDNDTFIFNNAPYTVFIPIGTKAYYYEDNKFIPYICSGLVGRFTVTEEKFYDKYIYCKVKDTEDWVKLADVKDITKGD